MNFIIAEFAIAVPAGFFVMISLFFTKQQTLRLVNIIGSLLFIAYGVCLIVLSNLETGWTTVALNVMCTYANITWLVKHKKSELAASRPDANDC